MTPYALAKLAELRDQLVDIPPYPWSSVEEWIVSAEPVFVSHFPLHLEGLRKVTQTPRWTQVARFVSGGGVWDKHPRRDNFAEAAAAEQKANRQHAEQAHGRILAFLGSVLDMAEVEARSPPSGGIEPEQLMEPSMTQSDPRKVFVIHGRNLKARHEVGLFLRSLGLIPINFGDLRASMGGTPTVAEIVEKGMIDAQGVVALFTAEEYAALRPDYRLDHDKPDDVARWQARPNVLFEAGMAFGRDRKRVVFVLLGSPMLFTDLAGVHVLRPSNNPDGDRAVLRGALKSIGCTIEEDSTDWMRSGDLEGCIDTLQGVSTRDPFRSDSSR